MVLDNVETQLSCTGRHVAEKVTRTLRITRVTTTEEHSRPLESRVDARTECADLLRVGVRVRRLPSPGAEAVQAGFRCGRNTQGQWASLRRTNPNEGETVRTTERCMGVTVLDQWVVDLFRAIDSMDAPRFANAFAEDGSFRFGNAERAVGREQVEQSVSAFFSTIGGLSHQIIGVWSGRWDGGEVKSVEAEVTYTRKDGTRTPVLPVTSTIRMEVDRIKDYRVFMDASPLFAQ